MATPLRQASSKIVPITPPVPGRARLDSEIRERATRPTPPPLPVEARTTRPTPPPLPVSARATRPTPPPLPAQALVQSAAAPWAAQPAARELEELPDLFNGAARRRRVIFFVLAVAVLVLLAAATAAIASHYRPT